MLHTYCWYFSILWFIVLLCYIYILHIVIYVLKPVLRFRWLFLLKRSRTYSRWNIIWYKQLRQQSISFHLGYLLWLFSSFQRAVISELVISEFVISGYDWKLFNRKQCLVCQCIYHSLSQEVTSQRHEERLVGWGQSGSRHTSNLMECEKFYIVTVEMRLVWICSHCIGTSLTERRP